MSWLGYLWILRFLSRAIADEYYEAAYGKQGPQLWPLMEKVSALFSTDFAMNIGPRVRPELAERMQQVPAALAPDSRADSKPRPSCNVGTGDHVA